MKLKMTDAQINIDGMKLLTDEIFNAKKLVKTSKFLVKPSNETPWDQHIVNELWFVLKGSGVVCTGNDQIDLVSEGDVFFIESNIRHKVENKNDTDLSIFSVWWGNDGI